jgi:DNA-binding LytR/AlgR family response regulator
MISQITIPDQAGKKVVAIDDLMFFQQDNHYTVLHLTGFVTIVAERSFEELGMTLANSGFVSINKNTVINLGHIGSFTNDTVILTDGSRLTISRRKADDFKKEAEAFGRK